MSEVTSERFLEFVQKSQLVDAREYDKLMEKVRAKCDGGLPADAKRLAAVFEKKGLLTPWHTEKLLGGKYKGFFLGKYKLLGHIGTGGMSSVYLAQHMRMGDKRAIKVLPKNRVKDASYLARFQLEAKAIASLNHPNIVAAYDIDNEGDVHYIVMEYVDGVDLQALVKRDGPLDYGVAAELLQQAASGLAHAHLKGVIHRDVKPANLLIDVDGRVRLLDMGLALVAAGDDESLTVANNENVLGTADYLAPEQALNSHTVDHRADIYGLGCTLYFLLTGRPPFNDGTLAQRIAKHQSEMPESIKKLRPDCPGELEGILVKMIQKDPRYRYSTATEVADALAKFLTTVPAKSSLKARGGGGVLTGPGSSSISLSGTLTRRSGGNGDTVTNKNDDTLASSRSKLANRGLGSGDSGRLVDIKPKLTPSDLMDGSFLDLEIESGYRGGSKIIEQMDLARGGSGASRRSGIDRRGNATAAGSSGGGSGTSAQPSGSAAGPTGRGPTGRGPTGRGPTGGSHPGRGGTHPQPGKGAASTVGSRGINAKIVAVMLVVLFVAALGIGYGLARVLNG